MAGACQCHRPRDEGEAVSDQHRRNLDHLAQRVIAARRRRRLMDLLETVLEDLVALDGIDATRAKLKQFSDQLEHY